MALVPARDQWVSLASPKAMQRGLVSLMNCRHNRVRSTYTTTPMNSNVGRYLEHRNPSVVAQAVGRHTSTQLELVRGLIAVRKRVLSEEQPAVPSMESGVSPGSHSTQLTRHILGCHSEVESHISMTVDTRLCSGGRQAGAKAYHPAPTEGP